MKRIRINKEQPADPSPLDFFARLRWLDGRRLMQVIEPYRQRIFLDALHTFRPDCSPRYNLVLCGRGKKNWKSADLVLAALYCLLIRQSPLGNDGFIVANDEGQAGDDLLLAKKLIALNMELEHELDVRSKEIKRKDHRGALKILPAGDVASSHGKTAAFIGYDEIHGYRDWSLMEALQPDPTRTDSLQWITSYDQLVAIPGRPLHDLKKSGIKGEDPRMLFSWYSGELCTDPDFAEFEPELRANPSISSWPEGVRYLQQQKRRLPTHKYRRLHLNLPGAPDGAFFDPDKVVEAIVESRKALQPDDDGAYFGFVDMSGGSIDDACLAIAHEHDGKAIIDLVMKQVGTPPFNPRMAVKQFADQLKRYHLSTVTGDAYAGQTFRVDFEEQGITYQVSRKTKTQLYEALEPRLNAGEVELPDIPKLQEQLLTLVMRGTRVDHQPGDHDDFANAAAGAVELAIGHAMQDLSLIAGPIVLQRQPYVDLNADPEVRTFQDNAWR